jgi:hypothetical protein
MARGQKSSIIFSRRSHLVLRGKASWIPKYRTIEQAIAGAGL